MDRRGMSAAMEVVVGLVLGLLVVAIVLYFIRGGTIAWGDTFTCPKDDEQYACVLASDGCTGEYSRALGKFCGKVDGKSQTCCVRKGDGKSVPGSDADEPDITVRAYAVNADIAGAIVGKYNPAIPISSLEPIANGKTLGPIVERPLAIMVEVEVANCDPKVCTPELTVWEFSAKTRAGEEILTGVADRLLVTEKKSITDRQDLSGGWAQDALKIGAERKGEDAFYTDRNLVFVFPKEYADETITFTAKAIYTAKAEKGEQPETEEGKVTLFLTPKPAVRYGGLTTRWEQKKTITAICESPVECEGIYYTIVQGQELAAGDTKTPIELPVCNPPASDAFAAARPITELYKWCVIDEYGQTQGCFKDQKTCIDTGLGQYNDPAYTAAYEVFKKQLAEGKISPEVGVLFQTQENKVSRRTCAPDLKAVEDAEGLLGRPFKAVKPNQDTDRWTFTLELPSMQNKYLCVYGKSRDSATVYSAGQGQQIKIDRTPPVGWIEFKGSTLTLSFYCQDTNAKGIEGSGCDDTRRGLAYIDDPMKFFPALFSGDPQSAVLWCPQGNAYRIEQRQQIPYTDELVRVLCMRVVDKAGNEGYAMTTVYNAYSALAAALQKYAQGSS